MEMWGEKQARERVDERLSAYIDGALSPRERARLEARLAQDAALRARLESLRRTVALVRGLPAVPAPRNFLLTPAMVRPRTPVARRLAPALTFATVVSGLLCVILVMGNLLAAGVGGRIAAAPAPMAAPEGTAAQTLEGAAKAPPAATSPETPMLRAAVPETPPPETGAGGEEPPSLIEGAPVPPDLGGYGGGAAPETAGIPVPTPEPLPPAQVTAAGEPATPAAPPSPPGELPAETAWPVTPWLPVGGLALLTTALAVLSVRAWRAR